MAISCVCAHINALQNLTASGSLTPFPGRRIFQLKSVYKPQTAAVIVLHCQTQQPQHPKTDKRHRTEKESVLFLVAAVIGFSLPSDLTIFDAPVVIDDDFVFSCFDSVPQPEKPLNLSGNWNAGYYEPSLPVYIAVPDRPPLILFTFESSDEIQGYLLSCTGDGTVSDSMLVYYWNSEGFISQTSRVTEDGGITVNILNDYSVNEHNTFAFNEDGSFTPVDSLETSADTDLEN
jgi:hypothetical protein